MIYHFSVYKMPDQIEVQTQLESCILRLSDDSRTWASLNSGVGLRSSLGYICNAITQAVNFAPEKCLSCFIFLSRESTGEKE